MKKLFLVIIAIMLCGCGNVNETVVKQSLINPEGNTLETRIEVPGGYVRVVGGSLVDFLRGYKLKEDGAPVLLFNGREKGFSKVHAAVFTLPIENAVLQQCADSVMRIYAEYYWYTARKDEIAFHFTDGFLCEYSKWRDGYRVIVGDGDTRWEKSDSYDHSYGNFVKYLKVVFSYAGTYSMEKLESEEIKLFEMTVGDVILKGGTPGHVVMVVDECENEQGEKAFLLAQGFMPAQEFHIINNPNHIDDPWYYESEFVFPLKTAEYTFDNENMIRRLKY